MKKFTKGMLIAAGSLCAAGVVLGCVGVVGRAVTGEEALDQREYDILQNTWGRFGKWRLRFGRGRGITVGYDNVVFDDDHETVYGSFTDDSLRSEDVYRLDIEIGGGMLILQSGNKLEVKKNGSVGCQYYVEGDTFYLKQYCPVGGDHANLRLTLPEGIALEDVNISMGAGEVNVKDLLTAEKIDIDIDAGEITMEKVKAGTFSADVEAGSVTVKRLDAEECDIDVNMGSINLRDSHITGGLDAEVNMGEVSVFLRDSYEDHDYTVNCGMGEVVIESEDGKKKESAGFGNSMAFTGDRSNGKSWYNLDCSMGNIYIGFSGKDATGDTVDSVDTIAREELPEMKEVPEMEEMPEIEEVPEIEDIDLIEGSFPEGIGRKNENMTAEYVSFGIQVSEPMVISISCVTESGELDLEIKDVRGRKVFDKEDIRTGDYEVKIDSAGIYKVCFEADDHTGSFWIKAKESE